MNRPAKARGFPDYISRTLFICDNCWADSVVIVTARSFGMDPRVSLELWTPMYTYKLENISFAEASKYLIDLYCKKDDRVYTWKKRLPKRLLRIGDKNYLDIWSKLENFRTSTSQLRSFALSPVTQLGQRT